jgi:hypothetical protein
VTRLRADFLYEVRGLWISDALMGQSLELLHKPYTMAITFPQLDPADDSAPQAPFPGRPSSLNERGFSGSRDTVEGLTFRSVTLLRVEMRAEGSISSADFEPEATASAISGAVDFLHEARRVADVAVSHLQDWANSMGQSLGLHGLRPGLTGATSLMDDDADRRLPVSWAELHGEIEAGGSSSSVTVENKEALRLYLESWEEIPLSDTLLADARQLIKGSGHDLMRAVLMAAIAVEIEVKLVLRQKSPAGLRPFIEVALESPRDFSFAAAALLDKPLKAACGRSLREDDAEAFTKVNQLFKVRNDIAHRGKTPSPDDVRASTKAAADAVAWLRRIPAHSDFVIA